MIPEHTKQQIDLYVAHEIHPGGFLYALLTNNLKETCMRADEMNQRAIFDIVSYLYNNTPMDCWGSKERVNAWLDDA